MARELFEDKSRALMGSSSGMGFGFAGPDPVTDQIQPGFGHSGGAEIFNMEMIGFSKAAPPPDTWRGFFSKPNPPVGSSKNEAGGGFYQQFETAGDVMDQSGWQNDDSSLRCVFPCEGSERPSQGLSLSLSSTDPSGIGVQSFELRRTQNDNDHTRFIGDDQMMHDAGVRLSLRRSKYLGPAQELLNEFCSLETTSYGVKKVQLKNKQLEGDVESSSSRNKASSSSSLCSLDAIELHKTKAKLLSMLEEVDRRYRHYCDQMKAVESVLESAAGPGSAAVYSALASKAMSRHFRCLRDGIVVQIEATKKAIGEKDTAAPGASRGETPRLRVLDQTLRQQRAFQQMTMMESHPWRPQRGLPERSVSVLRAWLFEHFLHPYPSDVDKHILARQTGLSRSQVSNWFINARVRLWKPMVEEMYVEETKEQDNMGGSSDDPSGRPAEDHKPTADQLVCLDSDCLSSIVTNHDSSSKAMINKLAIMHQHNNNYNTTSYAATDLDFANFNPNTVSFGHRHDASNINFNTGNIGGGGVSLTLGLQQHGGNGSSGVSLAFSPAEAQSSMFYARAEEPAVYTAMMDGGEEQNLPYRNLMGAQLLRDLAG